MGSPGTHASFPFQGHQAGRTSGAPLRGQCLLLSPSASPPKDMVHFSEVLQRVLSRPSHSPARHNHFCSSDVSQDFSPLQLCSDRSKQGACVQDRNLCIHPADPLLPVLWGNAWNTCTVYPSGNPKRCCSYLLPKNTEREIKRISIIYSESTLTYFYL